MDPALNLCVELGPEQVLLGWGDCVRCDVLLAGVDQLVGYLVKEQS